MTKPTFKNVPNELVTTTDGRKVWISRSVAVTIVIFAYVKDDIYVAISKRGKAMVDKPGLWNLPAGFLDYSESADEAVKREAWEEVGLNVDDIVKKYDIEVEHLDQPWFVKSTPDENRQNVTLRYGFMFKADSIEKLPKLIANNDCPEPNEVEQALWVKLEDLEDYEFAFDHDKVIWQYYNLLGEIL
jgi:8-oxo-dGTP pyrophosphatase MutT (NUDIX family)